MRRARLPDLGRRADRDAGRRIAPRQRRPQSAARPGRAGRARRLRGIWHCSPRAPTAKMGRPMRPARSSRQKSCQRAPATTRPAQTIWPQRRLSLLSSMPADCSSPGRRTRMCAICGVVARQPLIPPPLIRRQLREVDCRAGFFRLRAFSSSSRLVGSIASVGRICTPPPIGRQQRVALPQAVDGRLDLLAAD